jgi:predicted phage terminase large subunit-like protein
MCLSDVLRVQLGTPELARAVVQFCLRNKLETLRCESNGVGLPTCQTIRRLGIPVQPVNARTGKISRAGALEVRLSTGTVFFRENAPWLPEWEQELLLFPAGPHLDQVDAAAHAASFVSQRFPEVEHRLMQDTDSPAPVPVPLEAAVLDAREKAEAEAKEQRRDAASWKKIAWEDGGDDD